MIIDAHTHMYPDSIAGKALRTVIANTDGRLTAYTDGTGRGLTESMNAAGIDRCVVLTVATNPGQGRGILQWIRGMVPSFPHMVFFGSVHPLDPGFKDCIREMAEFGIQGVKFHPGYQGFPVDSPAAYAVYEEALKRNMVLYFHAGYDPSLPGCDYTSLKRFEGLLKDFKGSKIILAHGGGYGEWDRVLELLGDKGCYFDIAFVLESMMHCGSARELFRQNEDRFLFGSDSPWRDQKKYVGLIRDSETLTPGQKDKLFFRNVRKLIQI